MTSEATSRRAAAATARSTGAASAAATQRTARRPTPRPALPARDAAKRRISAAPAAASVENRNGLIVDCELTAASGTCEREAGLRLLARQRRRERRRRMSVGADRGYDTRDFVAGVRELRITPHVAAKTKSSAVDGRTTRHAGYAVSQRRRRASSRSPSAG